MFKFAGILLLMAGCIGLGFNKVAEEKRRIRELREIRRMVMRIQSEMAYGKRTLPEICLLFGQCMEEPYRTAFLSAYEKFAEKFAAAYGAQYDIRLFQCAYERMLTKADRIGIEDLPRTKEGQNRNIGSLFLGWFSQPQQTRIKAILEQDRYIPQEILNIQDMV